MTPSISRSRPPRPLSPPIRPKKQSNPSGESSTPNNPPVSSRANKAHDAVLRAQVSINKVEAPKTEKKLDALNKKLDKGTAKDKREIRSLLKTLVKSDISPKLQRTIFNRYIDYIEKTDTKTFGKKGKFKLKSLKDINLAKELQKSLPKDLEYEQKLDTLIKDQKEKYQEMLTEQLPQETEQDFEKIAKGKAKFRRVDQEASKIANRLVKENSKSPLYSSEIHELATKVKARSEEDTSSLTKSSLTKDRERALLYGAGKRNTLKSITTKQLTKLAAKYSNPGSKNPTYSIKFFNALKRGYSNETPTRRPSKIPPDQALKESKLFKQIGLYGRNSKLPETIAKRGNVLFKIANHQKSAAKTKLEAQTEKSLLQSRLKVQILMLKKGDGKKLDNIPLEIFKDLSEKMSNMTPEDQVLLIKQQEVTIATEEGKKQALEAKYLHYTLKADDLKSFNQ